MTHNPLRPANPPPRPRDADGTRARILNSAEVLFGQKGLDGIRLREIAERASVTVPLVCHHFKDKETLYAAVIDLAMGRFAALGWDVLRHATGLEGRLVALVTGLVDMLAADPAMTAVLHRELADGGERARPFAEQWFRPLMEAAIEEIRQGQARGELRPGYDPECLMLHVVSAVIYPFVAAPLVRVVWGADPLSAELLARRKLELIALLRPLLTV